MTSGGLTVGYAAMLEQLTPSDAVTFTAHAEEHGFSGCMAGDHFAPWVPQQGQAASIWPVLAAVGERTRGDFGSGVVAPGWRWHPAVVAQASATLAAMYPGRHWLGLGAGEALNEHVVAPYWPEGGERSARLFEAVDLMIRLFEASAAGKDTRFEGTYHRHETTRLWTMPEQRPDVLVATAGPLNAARTGRHADGIITVGAPVEKVEGLLARFDEGARKAGKDPSTMPKVLQLHLSWAPTHEEAVRNALVEWPNGGMAFPKADIRSPHDFAAMARLVREEDFAGRMVISEDPDVHRAAIQRYVDLGFDRVYLHDVGRDQRRFVEVFGRDVLPALHR